ncbi:hypothetical protein GCM10020216_015190 [Nonomuraea helvata]
MGLVAYQLSAWAAKASGAPKSKAGSSTSRNGTFWEEGSWPTDVDNVVLPAEMGVPSTLPDITAKMK